jgi:hypothetical protein
MSNRGRPRKPESARKSEPVSIRLTPELRARLEEERTKANPAQTLSQEIEMRLRESFDFDRSMQKLLGGHDYHYWLLRVIAEVIVSIEYDCKRQFVNDRYTFDHVKYAVDTILDRFEPEEISSPPEHLARVLEEQATKEFGKRRALLALVGIELAPKHRGNVLVLTEFVDPIAASKHLAPLIRKPVIKELNEIWEREHQSELKLGKPEEDLT